MQVGIQGFRQLIEHRPGATALVQCNAFVQCGHLWIFEGSVNSVLMTKAGFRFLKWFLFYFIILKEMDSELQITLTRPENQRDLMGSDMINGGVTSCSPFCLVKSITEQGLNPVYCFRNCHVVYS